MPSRYMDAVSPSYGTMTLELKSNGHIQCMGCASLWCEHLAEVTSRNLDQELIWEEPKEGHQREYLSLAIPMFPSQNLWTEVGLLPGDFGRYSIEWTMTLDADTYHVGYLNPGEGRGIIRSLLVDYMLGDTERRQSCNAAHHTYASEMRWQSDAAFPQRYTPQLWAVYTTGHCIGCLMNDTSADDLIPGKESTGVWGG